MIRGWCGVSAIAQRRDCRCCRGCDPGAGSWVGAGAGISLVVGWPGFRGGSSQVKCGPTLPGFRRSVTAGRVEGVGSACGAWLDRLGGDAAFDRVAAARKCVGQLTMFGHVSLVAVTLRQAPRVFDSSGQAARIILTASSRVSAPTQPERMSVGFLRVPR